MGYRRSVPTFTFMGVDRLNRTVNLVAENEERAVGIGGSRPRKPGPDGTLAVEMASFVSDFEDGRIELVVIA